ncbi:MAG: polysaccharide deacetylase family protein [Nitrospirae bacterium]|nr:polysaccharide deacetylase family protein [Nitrospirota bacterium]
MKLVNFLSRAQGRYIRFVAERLYRRPMAMQNTLPFISFTFDDFPRSALQKGGDILMRFGLRATYYASLGLMGTKASTGMIFIPDDIKKLLAQGHELGCHTFAHSHSWKTSPRVFEESIINNNRALDNLVPGAVFRSFSYPILGPRPFSKRRAGRYFDSCRGGGQKFNIGTVDLNYLNAFFLEKSRDNPRFVEDIIDQNSISKGWLIFATHDISESPTLYGCTSSFFERIVKYSLYSGAKILPVAEALDEIRVSLK